MATKYCDHGAYAAYSATPTWGVPQDGDGAAKTASSASAICSIDLTGATFVSGSSTISIMGATALTITGSANSATNVLYNATLTTMIDNIVTVINTLATATIVNKPAGWGAPQVRNAVFARRNGNSLELMTRTGSASWNGLVAVAFTNVTGASSGTWSGGVSGCWGYAFNHNATIWPSATAIGGYGIWGATTPNAGVMDAGDIVKVRSNKTITLTSSTNVSWTMAAMGSTVAPVRFDIDDGTEWPADGTTPVFKITQAHTGNTNMQWSHSTGSFIHVRGKQYASGQRNLVLETTGNGPSVPTIVVTYSGPVRFDFLDMYCPGTPTATPGPQSSCSAQFKTGPNVSSPGRLGSVFYKCRIVQPGQAPSAATYGMFQHASNAPTKVNLNGCEFVLTAPQTAWNFFGVAYGNSGVQRITFDSCKFIGFVPGSKLFVSAPNDYQQATLRNCSLGGIDTLLPSSLSSSTGDNNDPGIQGLYISSQYGNREFYIERPGKLMAEWNASKGRPYLNAKLPDGVTPWQIYAVTGTVSTSLAKHGEGVEVPAIKKLMPTAVNLPEAIRTIKANFLVESTLAWNRSDISISISYMDTDGNIQFIDSYDPDGAALTASSAGWSATTWGGRNWTPYEFSVVTPTAIKAETEVSLIFRLHSAVANDTLGVIIDPELVVS